MNNSGSQKDLYIGIMSGTSMDAVDIALVDFSAKPLKLIAYKQFDIDEELKASVRSLDQFSSLAKVTELDAVLGHLFADAVLELLKTADLPAKSVSAIGNHGQTILHLPEDDYPRTLQIGDPNIISYKTGITTVSDFRRADLAAGGQGAPLAPAFHEYAFRSDNTERVILNLGGIANITHLPTNSEQAISGFDTGPGNGLLDDWNQKHKQTEMDRDSAWALTGSVSDDLLSRLMSDPYFNLDPPKSSGRDYFNLTWLKSHLDAQAETVSAEDVQATLLELTVTSIAESITRHADSAGELYLCGGGAHNGPMCEKLAKLLPKKQVSSTTTLGIDPDAVEAVTFAWLAMQTMEHRFGSAPSVTGAKAAQILGGIYPVKPN